MKAAQPAEPTIFFLTLQMGSVRAMPVEPASNVYQNMPSDLNAHECIKSLQSCIRGITHSFVGCNCYNKAIMSIH